MDFSSALETRGSEIERPPLLPIADYRCQVMKVPEIGKAGDDWDKVDIFLRPLEAVGEFDSDAIAAFGPLKNAVLKKTFMFSKTDENSFKQTLFQLKQSLANAFKVEGVEDMTLKQSLNAVVNKQCIASVKWRADKTDPSIQYAEPGKLAPVE